MGAFPVNQIGEIDNEYALLHTTEVSKECLGCVWEEFSPPNKRYFCSLNRPEFAGRANNCPHCKHMTHISNTFSYREDYCNKHGYQAVYHKLLNAMVYEELPRIPEEDLYWTNYVSPYTRCNSCLWATYSRELNYNYCLLNHKDFGKKGSCSDYISIVDIVGVSKTRKKIVEQNKLETFLIGDTALPVYLQPKQQEPKEEKKNMSIKDVIAMADKCRDEIVLCLIGAPGIGKTQAVYEFAKENGRNVVEIIASQILPNEVSGITMPVQESKSMEIFDHARLSSLKDGDILFFDELLQAAPSTLSACLTLIQERRLMSGKKLPDVLIIAATNPQASASLTPLSIRQRFMFYECKWDKEAWRQWIKDTLGYDVTESLLDSIVTDGDTLNVFTPRTCTKLLTWIKETDENPDTYEAIERMFGTLIARYLRGTVHNVSPNQQIVDTVVEYYKNKDNCIATTLYSEEGKDALNIKLVNDSLYDEETNSYVDTLENRRLPVEEMKDCDGSKLMEILTSLPEWEEIKEELANTEEF